MSEVLDTIDIIGIVFLIIILLAQSAGFAYWVNFELKQLRKDMESGDKSIEEVRLANVGSLKIIYDQKIEDSRVFAKNLYENHYGEHKALNDKMDNIQNQLAQILDILIKK